MTLACDDPRPLANYLLALHYADDVGPAEIARQATMLAGHIAQAATPWSHAAPRAAAVPTDATEERRLRVGFLSPDFLQHPVARFVEGLFGALDRTRVEPVAYAANATEDRQTARLRALVPDWVRVAGLDDAELAARIRADRIDILIDMAGHTAGSRLAVLAWRPAPVQATWLGYAGTTGLATVD